MDSGNVVIAIATYKRPRDIARCLASVSAELERYRAEHSERSVSVVVIDNDAEGSAREAVGAYDVSYHVEPEPGISAARNRALQEAGNADLLIFIDDDEEVTPGWLAAMLETYDRYRPAAVAGAVESAFENQLDPWIEAGGFFQRLRPPTGTQVGLAATNNLLLDLRIVRELGLTFENAYGLTGGGDTDFTKRLVRHGHRIVRTDDAVVVDHVPASRATRSWVLARHRRMGNSEVVIGLRLAADRRERAAVTFRALSRGIFRLVAGLVMRVVGRMTGRTRLEAQGARIHSRGRGMLDGLRGHTVSEYQR